MTNKAYSYHNHINETLETVTDERSTGISRNEFQENGDGVPISHLLNLSRNALIRSVTC